MWIRTILDFAALLRLRNNPRITHTNLRFGPSTFFCCANLGFPAIVIHNRLFSVRSTLCTCDKHVDNKILLLDRTPYIWCSSKQSRHFKIWCATACLSISVRTPSVPQTMDLCSSAIAYTRLGPVPTSSTRAIVK